MSGPAIWRYQGMVRSSASWALVARHLIRALAAAHDIVIELDERVADRFDPSVRIDGLPVAPPRSQSPDLVFSYDDPRILEVPASVPLMLLTVVETDRLPIPFVPAMLRADLVIAPSRFVADACLREGIAPERVRLVPHGYDPAVFGAAPLPSGRKSRLLFIGTPARRKGLDVLLDALATRPDLAPHCELVLKLAAYADAERRSYLVHDWPEKVARLRRLGFTVETIIGHLPDARLRALIDSVDIVCHPHRGEGFCLPLLEVAACGRAIITTDWGAPRDYLPPDAALMLPPTVVSPAREELPEPAMWPADAVLRGPDVAATAAAIAALVGDRRRCARLGAAAAEAVRDWTWDNSARQLFAAGADLAASRRIAA